MKYNEIERLQQLAGIITEIKVNSPGFDLNKGIIQADYNGNNNDYLEHGQYVEMVDLGKYLTFIPWGGSEMEDLKLFPKEDFSNIQPHDRGLHKEEKDAIRSSSKIGLNYIK